MSDWELLSAEPGLRKYIRAGDEPDSVDVRYEHDAATVLEANKRAQNESFERRSDLWHVARIPIGVMYEWLVKHGVNAWNPDHGEAVKKLLNSSDYRWLKTKDIII